MSLLRQVRELGAGGGEHGAIATGIAFFMPGELDATHQPPFGVGACPLSWVLVSNVFLATTPPGRSGAAGLFGKFGLSETTAT